MALKDGMLAITKVLKVMAIVFGGGWAIVGISDNSPVLGLIMGALFFLLFWTPAWVIKKFVQ
jgi:hypothetical protein